MGIFSQNIKPSLDGATVEAAVGYGGVDAGARIKLEGYQNDMALFTAIIESDFNAARATHEGAVNEATAITEGTVGSIFTKIKDFFKKLWEKLKGMIQSFMVKFVAVFVRDNKQLVKKYSKQIEKQFRDSKRKYDEMEFKMTEGYYKYLTGELNIKDMGIPYAKDYSIKEWMSDDTLDKLKEDIDNKIIDKIKSLGVSISELSEFKKELNNTFVGEKESYTGYTKALNDSVEKELTNGAKTISAAQQEKKKLDTEMKQLVNTASSVEKEFESMEKGDEKELLIKAANAGYYAATQLQTVMTDMCSWKLNFLKGALKEIRALYIKAVSRRATNESADILDDIIDEAVDFDVESMFEADVEANLNDDDLSAELDSIDDLTKDEKCGEGCRK